MNFRILGAGWYGCGLAEQLLAAGHDVTVHEKADRIFTGASGGNPARLHQGAHYPRSALTRAHCQAHHDQFMARYGHLTRAVPVNLYAVARHDSLVDFGTYCQVLKNEIEFIEVHDPAEFGLEHVEGAILTGERHIVTDLARAHFEQALAGRIVFHVEHVACDDNPQFDWTIDCTFCAMDGAGIERYEPCVTALLRGPTDRAVTIMDGPFPSLYPWNEAKGLVSLTSASLTPIMRCQTRGEAERILASPRAADLGIHRAQAMIEQIREFYPAIEAFELSDVLLSIRAQPRSGCDARLVELVQVGERAYRIRAGKIDAVLHAADLVRAACLP